MRTLPILILGLVAARESSAQDHAAHVHGHVEAEGAAMPAVLDLPMSRNGSGTAWAPDATPVRAHHGLAGGWHLMLHYDVFAGYDVQATDAGDDALVSQNWVMGMASRALGGGVLVLRGMFSLEPLTVPERGYPLLMQTGETHDGAPIVDHQHPHDLFMEAAAIYQREVGAGVALEGYAALAGEPALGPVAFPHRASATSDPFAPLSHHWLDSTHITFGVLTAGAFTRHVKAEGSWFNGREPDEERWDLDLRAPDSFSARVSVNPDRHWSAQASGAYLASPELLEPDESVQRWTASLAHSASGWSSLAAWGRNIPEHGPATDAFLVESAVDLGRPGVTFARAEYVVKTGHDFDLPMEDLELPVSNVSVGHVYPLRALADVEAGIGARGSIGVVDPDLEDHYGTRVPYGAMIYVQLQPGPM